jgi:hypothetical protein
MNAEERVLSQARKIWQDEAAPSETSVRRGVDRAVRRLRLGRHSAVAPRVWAASGAMAAFVATLAYAGRGGLLQPVWDALAARGAMTDSSHVTESESPAAALLRDRAEPTSLSPASNSPAAHAGMQTDRALALDSAKLGARRPLALGAHEETASGETLNPLPVTASQSPLSIGVSAVARPDARAPADIARGANKASPSETAREPGSRATRARTTAAARRAAGTAHANAAPQPTWSDVNEALAAHDRTRAIQLLALLADKGPDADTRAKALLGIAQLSAGAGDCENGRTLALEVAARPGIEIKTVRRALELASRCAR